MASVRKVLRHFHRHGGIFTQGLFTQNSNPTHTDRYEKNILRGGNCFMFGLKFLSDLDFFSTGNKF